MMNFWLTNISAGSLTIEKPSGKAIQLKMGETVKAQITDMLPSGLVTLKIKGDFITAKTDIPLLKGFTALLKVTSLNTDNGELKLQFIEYINKDAAKQQIHSSAFNLKESALPKLLAELSGSITNAHKNPSVFQESGTDISKLQKINAEILKALPQDINSLPKKIVLQLKSLLQASLQISGDSIQSRLQNLISTLPEPVKNHSAVTNIQANLLISIDKLLDIPMRNILQDSGILLEAKLRAIAELIRQTAQQGNLKSSSSWQASEILQPKKVESSQTIKHSPMQQDNTFEKLLKGSDNEIQKETIRIDINALKKDLKAGLLQLRQFIMEETVKEMPLRDFTAAHKDASLKVINTLIRDIETFQLLSKTTDSFYTFIPLNWKEIKDGNIAFKKGRSAHEGSSYSCRINLDLERFGSLSAVILMSKGEFFVSFNAEHPNLKEILKDNSLELQESFKSRGLNLKTVNVMDASENSMEHLQKLESLESLVDIKI